jgi:hypothetical protein
LISSIFIIIDNYRTIVNSKIKGSKLPATHICVEVAGFIAKPTDTGSWPMISVKELNGQLCKLIGKYEDGGKKVIYAEVLEHARQVVGRYEKIRPASSLTE